jgi:uncharacterized membrane protein (GlpM family)
LLALKLLLVPFFLGLISLAGKRWGPGFAGWLAGLPVIVGPILFLLALERGAAYARDAAVYTLGAVFPVIVFGIGYAWASKRMQWPGALLSGYAAWLLAALLLLALPLNLSIASAIALVTLLAAPYLFPQPAGKPGLARMPHHELGLRMLAGALLTLAVTSLANIAGPNLSGLLALFPVLSAILAAFTHRTGGADSVITLLAALARGLASLAGFCLALPLLLDRVSIGVAFLLSVAVALIIQAALCQRKLR